MANSQTKKKLTQAVIEAYALSFQVMISEIYDATQPQQDGQDAIKTVERTLKKTIQMKAADAPSSNGAEGEVEETDFVEEGLHVMFNGKPWTMLKMDLSPQLLFNLNLQYGGFVYFAAPIDYARAAMVTAGKEMELDEDNTSISYQIGRLNEKADDTNVYEGKMIEMFLPEAFNNSIPTTRTKGYEIQDFYLKKCSEMMGIVRSVKQMMRRLFKTSQNQDFTINQYGQLYYAMYLKGEETYVGWHRGVDVNYRTGPNGNHPPVYNLADGIVVGRSDYTMLDVYIPHDNVTITYMHFRPTNSQDDTTQANSPEHLKLGKRLKQFQYIGLQDKIALNGKVGIHVHIEINEGCCCSSWNSISEDALAIAIENYYDSLILDCRTEKQYSYSAIDYEKDHKETEELYKMEINDIEMERQKRKEKAVGPRKIDTAYSIYTEGFDSLYPYDYYNKWCQ